MRQEVLRILRQAQVVTDCLAHSVPIAAAVDEWPSPEHAVVALTGQGFSRREIVAYLNARMDVVAGIPARLWKARN